MHTDLLPSTIPLEDDEWQQSYQRMMRGGQAMPGTDPMKLREAIEKMYTGQVDFDLFPGPTGNGRVISVPLQKLDKCGVCSKTTALRLCSSCASVRFATPARQPP